MAAGWLGRSSRPRQGRHSWRCQGRSWRCSRGGRCGHCRGLGTGHARHRLGARGGDASLGVRCLRRAHRHLLRRAVLHAALCCRRLHRRCRLRRRLAGSGWSHHSLTRRCFCCRWRGGCVGQRASGASGRRRLGNTAGLCLHARLPRVMLATGLHPGGLPRLERRLQLHELLLRLVKA